MDLVFFPDAIINLIKISRIIRNPGGNMMLVQHKPCFSIFRSASLGGCWRQWQAEFDQTRLIYRRLQNLPDHPDKVESVALEILNTSYRTYNSTNFLEDLKNLFRTTGVTGYTTEEAILDD